MARLLIFVVSCVCSVGEASDSIRAGAFVADITPETFPVSSAGSMSPRFAEVAADPLNARCLVLESGETTIAFAIVDSCMVPREIFDAAKEKASAATGIPTSHMLMSATHTHTAVTVTPAFQSDVETEYVPFLIERIAEGVIEAHRRLEPAKVGWAVGRNASQVFNRRWYMRPGSAMPDPFDRGTDRVRMNPPRGSSRLVKPAGLIDPEVPLLCAQAIDGRPIAVLANYSLHYVGGVTSKTLSADYFGEFARLFAAKLPEPDGDYPPVMVAMTNGTSGDINNINFYEASRKQEPFEQIRVVAADVARSAKVAYDRIEFETDVPIAVRQTEVTLGVRKPSADDVAFAKQVLANFGAGPYRDRRAIYASETLDLVDYPNTVQVKLQAIRIGDLAIVTTPCETFVATGLAIKAKSPFKPTFTIELTNGYNGYLPTREQHALGGYETWRAKSSYLAVGAEEKIRSTLLDLLTQLANE